MGLHAMLARTRPGVLQLALDSPSLTAGLVVVTAVRDWLGRVEVGTPLLISAGLDAVRRMRDLVGPEVHVVADTKVCDAGSAIARAAFTAGADVVTVVAAAIDDQTWAGVLAEARDAVNPDRRPPTVLIDIIGPRVDLDRLAELVTAANDADVPVEVCVHRAKVHPRPFVELFDALGSSVTARAVRVLVAGRMEPPQVGPALAAGFTTVVVGSAVTASRYPGAVWQQMIEQTGPPIEASA